MKRISTKTTAEAALRELPSVLGAYVSEDMDGHPREIHLLIRPGPEPGHLARDIRQLLEERLGVPIDQRVISIAQLSPESDESTRSAKSTGEPSVGGGIGGAGRRAGARPAEARPVFAGIESTVSSGHVKVRVRLEWEGEVSEGEADAVDTQAGRARATAGATLQAAMDTTWNGDLRFELDFASIVQALDGEYVLVSTMAMSGRLGRRPLALVGAHPIDGDVETGAALATLKAINRVLALALAEESAD